MRIVAAKRMKPPTDQYAYAVKTPAVDFGECAPRPPLDLIFRQTGFPILLVRRQM
jgi:hypothetical protein